MIRLIALDLDNTLLDEDKTIAQDTIRALREFQAGGGVVCLATGRMYATARKYMEQIGPGTVTVCFNGALVPDPFGGEPIFESFISENIALELIKYSKERGLFLQFYEGDAIVVEDIEKSCRIDPDRANGMVKEIGDFMDYTPAPSPKALIECKPEEQEMITSELRNHFGESVIISHSEPFLIEVTMAGAQKANCLSALCQKLGIAREETMACGDNDNDLSMIKWAGLGVAVSNAVPALKAAADYVTEAPRSSGVKEAVERFCKA